MTSSFDKNWAFQENYTKAIQDITTDNAFEFMAIRTATEHEDKRQGTDFVVELKDGTNIAARVRRPSCKYRDLTIRTYNKGHKTEIHKLREGFGSHYIYCWTSQDWAINEYILVDLDCFRSSGMIDGALAEIDNKDGLTRFASFSIRNLKRNRCLIKHWEAFTKPEPEQETKAKLSYNLWDAISRYYYEKKIRKMLGDAYRKAKDAPLAQWFIALLLRFIVILYQP